MRSTIRTTVILIVILSLIVISSHGISAENPKMALSLSEKSLKPGKTATVEIDIDNPLNGTTDLRLTVISEKSDWVKLTVAEDDKDKVPSNNDTVANLTLAAGESATLIMKITPPFDQEKENFNYTLELTDQNSGSAYDEQDFTLKVEDPKSSVLLFFLALTPLLVIFVGIIKFKQPGMRMAIIGWLVALLIAVLVFRTSTEAALWATVVGLIKSMGITVAVMFTMFMIFLMKETGALKTVADAAKNVVKTKEEQAIFLGIGFGSFLTCLGVVTPALFPPLLMAMGFTPFASVAIAVLGYNATTSFALLSIPITLPSEIFGLDPYALCPCLQDSHLFAYRLCRPLLRHPLGPGWQGVGEEGHGPGPALGSFPGFDHPSLCLAQLPQ